MRLGMLKVDVLALGMLSLPAQGVRPAGRSHVTAAILTLANACRLTDKATYDMLCKADSLGRVPG